MKRLLLLALALAPLACFGQTTLPLTFDKSYFRWGANGELQTLATGSGSGIGVTLTNAAANKLVKTDSSTNLTTVTGSGIANLDGSAAVAGTDYVPATAAGVTNALGSFNGSSSSYIGGDNAAHALPSSATGSNPTAAVGLTAVNGSASTFMRSDAAPALGTVGTAGTYRSVTTDAAGRVTAGTAPTTFSGYAISDTSANLAAALTDETGTGSAVFGTSPTITTPVFNTSITLNGGTLTGASTPVINAYQTWNNSGTNYTGILLNVTNTASASGSLLMDLQVGATSQLSVGKAGDVTAKGNITSAGGTIASSAASTFNLQAAAGQNIQIQAGAGGGIYIATGQIFNIQGAGYLAFSGDTILTRDSANTIQLGLDGTAPSNQGFKAADATGTDHNGAALTLEGGQSTGAGAGGALSGATSQTSTTGSSANSYSTRFYHSAKFVNLTESTATLFGNIALASSKYVGASLVCTVTANDGTNFQSLTSQVRVDAVNKAGTVTAAITQTDNTAAVSSGTLTASYTAVANGNGVDLKCNAVSSLTQTVLTVKWQIVGLNSDDAGTITAQ